MRHHIPRLLLTLVATALLTASCARYHFGISLPKSQRDVAVTPVENHTTEPTLASLLQDALRERIANTTGLKLTGEEDATLAVSVKITSLDQRRAASAKARNKKSSHDDGDSYQTVAYRMTMVCEYIAAPTREDAIPYTGSVTVSADLPLMQDPAIAQQTALKQLARNAAMEIMAEVSDR